MNTCLFVLDFGLVKVDVQLNYLDEEKDEQKMTVSSGSTWFQSGQVKVDDTHLDRQVTV